MAAAPTVQSLNDIIGQVTAAQAPQNQQIDQEIAGNQSSGDTAKAGLDTAQTNAFGKINQEASNKGMFFSGFTPTSEASYTGSTYLPALAKLQSTIAATRNTLLGQKATLQANANTDAMNIQKGEQGALDNYNMEVQREQNAAAEAERQRQFEVGQNAANRSAAAAKAPSLADQKAAAMGSLQGDLNNAFRGFGARPTYYTEHTIIPQLLASYAGSGLSNKEITDAVYGTRKALGYG